MWALSLASLTARPAAFAMPSRSTLWRHAKAKAAGRAVRRYETREARLGRALLAWENDFGATRCCECIARMDPIPDCKFCAFLIPEPEAELQAEQ